MKKQRKEELLNSFPPLDKGSEQMMHGKGACNFVFLLTRGKELFARCYHRYSDGIIIERQRYVFAKDGSCRYGSDYGDKFTVRTDFREPVFCVSSYGFAFNNTYNLITVDNAVEKSDMKYSLFNRYHGDSPLMYLHYYCKHPNIEYLIKAGYDPFTEHYGGWYGTTRMLRLSEQDKLEVKQSLADAQPEPYRIQDAERQ